MNTIIDLDHQLLWSWAAQVLLAHDGGVFTSDEHELRQLFGVCIRASLAGVRAPGATREEWEEQNRRFRIAEPNARELVHNSHLVLAFLSLPLLEAMAKKACMAFVDYAGQVLQPWSVPTVTDGVRSYAPSAPGSSRCSSVRDLLYLLRDTVAGADLAADLHEMEAVFAARDSTMHAFDAVVAWRNQALHGQTTHPTIGGTVLNIAILIGLSLIASDFDRVREEQVKQCQWERQTLALTGERSPWSYYPPY